MGFWEDRTLPLLVTSLAVVVRISAVLVRPEIPTTDASLVAADHATGREYCQWELFEASCDSTASGEHRVIVMRSARYGLMKVGRCVTKNYGHVGCFTDVLGHLDSLCSGRRRCRMNVPDDTVRALQPCPKEFTAYLEASYQCVTVATGAAGHCSTSRRRVIPLNVATGAVGYLSSSVADTTGHGTADCPWLLRAAPGQRINITLLEFDWSQTATHSTAASSGRSQFSVVVVAGGGGRLQSDGSLSSENEVDRQQHHQHLSQLHHRGGCAVQLAVIREHPSGFTAGAASTGSPTQASSSSPSSWETIVCSSTATSRAAGGGAGEAALSSQRERTVYLSTSNELEVTITRPPPHVYGSKSSIGVAQQPPTFLLRYEDY